MYLVLVLEISCMIIKKEIYIYIFFFKVLQTSMSLFMKLQIFPELPIYVIPNKLFNAEQLYKNNLPAKEDPYPHAEKIFSQLNWLQSPKSDNNSSHQRHLASKIQNPKSSQIHYRF